jgi:hypothetical protein
MNIIYRSWHFGCNCFLTLIEARIVASSRRSYIVHVPGHGYQKINRRRVLGRR